MYLIFSFDRRGLKLRQVERLIRESEVTDVRSLLGLPGNDTEETAMYRTTRLLKRLVFAEWLGFSKFQSFYQTRIGVNYNNIACISC